MTEPKPQSEREEHVQTVLDAVRVDLASWYMADQLGEEENVVVAWSVRIYQRLAALPVDDLTLAIVLLLAEEGRAEELADSIVEGIAP